ncbi:putative er lumen protein retaining receptor protein [Botrytis fragariae]|uniref:Putative er lumen protein retaining receptor protein n=1 Tax=Botrytis fragariae TaxID=1964551 RepID=A0A8H6AYP0_9HELO|nr:putative er lumen protein retaining receptor protein [Botrytis fragariae]KAF5875937.1 putative er lumen protein retaining receptor protein [Botrytis fragariae]
MNLFRILGDFSHLLSILILLHKMHQTNSCAGISFKSQALYLLVYVTRYLDLFWTFTDSLYNTTFKLLFLCSSGYTIYLMTTSFKPTHDPNLDTFRVQYLLGGSLALAFIYPYAYTPLKSSGPSASGLNPSPSFHNSSYSKELEKPRRLLRTISLRWEVTEHYIYRIGCGDISKRVTGMELPCLRTVLYSDFFWIYYTKVMKGKRFTLPV